VVTEAAKKHREIFAFGLLGVAALYFISGLSLILKSGDDIAGPGLGVGFTDKAALFGYVFSHPILVFSLLGAVLLVTGFGENSTNAKAVVTGALGIGGVSLLLGLICWLSAFGADLGNGGIGVFNGIFGAGKVVGIFLGLAQLGLLGLVTFFAFTAFQTFPRPVRAQQGQWGQQQGQWGQQQGQWGQQGGYDPGQQGQWGQPGAYGPTQPGQHSQPGQQGWGQPGGYDAGQQSWAASSGAPAGGWGEPSSPQAGPQDPQASTWGHPEHAAGWGQPDEPSQTPPVTPSWESPPSQPEPSSVAPPADEGAAPDSDETQAWERPAASPAGEPESAEDERDDDNPPQQGWWQQPN
jgi:hypothetical protein